MYGVASSQFAAWSDAGQTLKSGGWQAVEIEPRTCVPLIQCSIYPGPLSAFFSPLFRLLPVSFINQKKKKSLCKQTFRDQSRAVKDITLTIKKTQTALRH